MTDTKNFNMFAIQNGLIEDKTYCWDGIDFNTDDKKWVYFASKDQAKIVSDNISIQHCKVITISQQPY